MQDDPGYAAELEAMTNARLHEVLAGALTTSEGDPGEELWAEVGFRLGVDGVHGVRVGATEAAGTGRLATRLRRYVELWRGQPEADPDLP
jgi:hypothetical protein